jgi:DNA-binding FadR family transcriptional regulator
LTLTSSWNEQLAATIRASILSGELAEGQRMPSEARLADEAGVSRSTVREALRVLMESGFLERASPKILVVRGAAETPAHRAMTHALRRRTVTFSALHVAIAEASENPPLVLARTALGEVLVPTVAQFVDDERATEAATAFHERLYEQIAAGDPDLAAVIARRHVEDFRAAWEHSGLTYDRDVSELIDAAATRLAPTPDAS